MSLEKLFNEDIRYGGPLCLVISYLSIEEVFPKCLFICKSFTIAVENSIEIYFPLNELKTVVTLFNPRNRITYGFFKMIIKGKRFQFWKKAILYAIANGGLYLDHFQFLLNKFVDNKSLDIHDNNELILRRACKCKRIHCMKLLIEKYKCNPAAMHHICLKNGIMNEDYDMLKILLDNYPKFDYEKNEILEVLKRCETNLLYHQNSSYHPKSIGQRISKTIENIIKHIL